MSARILEAARLGRGILCASPQQAYTTAFNASEAPLSEGGTWRVGGTHGLDWTDVVTSGGLAYGTQDGLASPEFTDSVACLSGFPDNHQISAVVHKAAGITGIQEVELLLRWSINGHAIHGYECLWAHDGAYSGIVRWDAATPNGTGVGDGFVEIASGPGGFTPLAEGDVVLAKIVGTIITVTVNGAAFMTGDISAPSGGGAPIYYSGSPGIGFFRKNNGGSTNPQSYCFTSMSALGL